MFLQNCTLDQQQTILPVLTLKWTERILNEVIYFIII